MKKHLLFVLFGLLPLAITAQTVSPETLAKRAKRKNLTVKEWNTDEKSKYRWLDRVTVYDSEGRKIEQIEYATYGMKWRETYEYDANGFLVKQVEYNDRNKPSRIIKFEFNADGTKAKQYNYLPNGKLYSIKVFEYDFKD